MITGSAFLVKGWIFKVLKILGSPPSVGVWAHLHVFSTELGSQLPLQGTCACHSCSQTLFPATFTPKHVWLHLCIQNTGVVSYFKKDFNIQ